ncbi:MAG: hypothetical protein AB7N76_00695 [Planctomycetota bacterium]
MNAPAEVMALEAVSTETISPEEISLEAGRVVSYRLFDVGDEILLAAARARLAGEGIAVSEVRVGGFSHEVALDLAEVGGPLEVEELGSLQVSARLFAQGMISVRFELAAPPGPLADTGPLLRRCGEHPRLAEEGRRVVERLRPQLGPTLVPGPVWEGVEDYTALLVTSLGGGLQASALRQRLPLVSRLLLGERGDARVAAAEVEELSRHQDSYLDDDLVVIHWDTALVVEPSGSREVLGVLEFACAVLTGLRNYDAHLDQEVTRFYEEARRRRRPLLGGFARQARLVQQRWLELTEFTERFENAIKVMDDHYYARVYRRALERFRVPDWQRSVDRKQGRLAQVYSYLKSEADTQRATLLEVSIVLLILVEIVLFALEKLGRL